MSQKQKTKQKTFGSEEIEQANGQKEDIKPPDITNAIKAIMAEQKKPEKCPFCGLYHQGEDNG